MEKQLWELTSDRIVKDIVHILGNENCCVRSALEILDRAKNEVLKQPCIAPNSNEE